MKLAFLIHPLQEITLPFDANGSTPNLTFQHAVRLGRAGHHVVIYAKRRRGQAATEAAAPGVTVRRLYPTGEDYLLKPVNFVERVRGLNGDKRPVFANDAYFIGYAHQVARDLAREGFDLVHLHNFSQFAPVIRSYNPDSRIVLHMHCDWLAQLDASTIERRLRDTDLILGCSNHVTDAVRRRFPHLADRCRTLYNGVDASYFTDRQATPATHPRRILYVGRVSPEKGLHVLVEAFKTVAARHPDVHLDIVGSARLLASTFIVELSDDERVAALSRFYGRTLRERLEKMLFTRNSSYLGALQRMLSEEEAQRVTFHGPIPHSRLVSHYQHASLVVNSSLSEAFGIPLAEAAACGLPCVAVRTGGVPEVVDDGNTGLVVPPDDPSALAEAISYVLKHEHEARAMGRSGRQRALALFTWDRLSEILMQHYASIDLPTEPRTAVYA